MTGWGPQVSIIRAHLWPSKYAVLGSIVLSHALFVIYAQSFGLYELEFAWRFTSSTQQFFGSFKIAKRRFQTLTAVRCTLLRCHSGICYVHPTETGRWLSSTWDQLTTLYSGKQMFVSESLRWSLLLREHIPTYPFRLQSLGNNGIKAFWTNFPPQGSPPLSLTCPHLS